MDNHPPCSGSARLFVAKIFLKLVKLCVIIFLTTFIVAALFAIIRVNDKKDILVNSLYVSGLVVLLLIVLAERVYPGSIEIIDR